MYTVVQNSTCPSMALYDPSGHLVLDNPRGLDVNRIKEMYNSRIAILNVPADVFADHIDGVGYPSLLSEVTSLGC